MEPTREAGVEAVSGMKPVAGPVVQIDEGRIQAHLDEVVRSTVEETVNGLLDAEADHLRGAKKYERTEGRKDTRAGSYDRRLQTNAGEVTLAVPKLPSLPSSRHHRTLPAARVLGRRSPDRDVSCRGERAPSGRHHASAVGHAGVGVDGQ